MVNATGVTTHDMAYYIAKVQDGGLLKLPEEAATLGLRYGDEVEVSVLTIPRLLPIGGASQIATPQERAVTYRAWAASHSTATPLLSDEAVGRESIYGERG